MASGYYRPSTAGLATFPKLKTATQPHASSTLDNVGAEQLGQNIPPRGSGFDTSMDTKGHLLAPNYSPHPSSTSGAAAKPRKPRAKKTDSGSTVFTKTTRRKKAPNMLPI